MANKIWYIEDQTLKEYPGTYEEYDHFVKLREENAEKARKEALQAQKQDKKVQKEERVVATKVENSPKPQDFGGNKQRKNQIRKLEKEQEDLELIIADSEKKKTALTLKMAEPAVAANYGKLKEVQGEIAKMDTHLAHLTEKWEAIVLELEQLASQN